MDQILALEQSPDDPEHRVLPFRARQPVSRPPSEEPASDSPVEGLDRFERPEAGDDDYGHRMWTNVLAFGFVILLVAGGIWMADTMATMRKNQDCVLSGRRTCNQFDKVAPGSLTPGSLTPSTATVVPPPKNED